jgi:hypothetical protein
MESQDARRNAGLIDQSGIHFEDCRCVCPSQQIASDQLATQITAVHEVITSLGKPARESEVERHPRCRSVDQFTAIMSSASNAACAARRSDAISLPAID